VLTTQPKTRLRLWRRLSALMGLAQRQGFLAASTDHYDETRAVADRVPLVLNRHGVMVAAPDMVILNLALQMVLAVEVETRSFTRHYPDACFADVAKLAPHVEVDLVSTVYARTIKGTDYDQAASWGQRDIADLLQAFQAGKLKHVETVRGLLLILKQRDLWELDQLWNRLRGGGET
jgi:hypothetical protein